jgi:hypothetical protein
MRSDSFPKSGTGNILMLLVPKETNFEQATSSTAQQRFLEFAFA